MTIDVNSPSAPAIWVGQVWNIDPLVGNYRSVVILKITTSKVRVRNLESGIRTWITRDLFDNPGNVQTPTDREFVATFDTLDDYFNDLMDAFDDVDVVTRRKQKIPAYEYAALINSARNRPSGSSR